MSETCSLWSQDAAHRPARALAAAQLEVYESATRAATELGWLMARSAAPAPVGSWVRAWADATRDATAVQLSTARWILDL